MGELVDSEVWQRHRSERRTERACGMSSHRGCGSHLPFTCRGTGKQVGIAPNGRDPDPIHTAPIGAVLILRGTLWTTEPPAGLRHRSPPIAGTGETRLLLVLDPEFAPEDAT